MTLLANITEEGLRAAGIRPTRPRLALARLLRDHRLSHVTPDQALALAQAAGLRFPLGTIYNVLNEFARAGLVRRLDMGERTCFCANQSGHHHFLDVNTGRLSDIPDPQPYVGNLPEPPPGMEIVGVDVMVRIRPKTENDS